MIDCSIFSSLPLNRTDWETFAY